MEEVGANELSFTPVGSWVVERGLFRFLSVYFRGPDGPFSFSFSFLSLSFLLSSPLLFSLCFSTLFSLHLLSRFCPVLYSVFATLLFRHFVSAAAFLFFSFDLYILLTPSLPSSPTSPPISLFTRARFSGFSCSPFRPPGVSTAKSIDRNVFRSGRNERESNRRKFGVGRSVCDQSDLKERRKKGRYNGCPSI